MRLLATTCAGTTGTDRTARSAAGRQSAASHRSVGPTSRELLEAAGVRYCVGARKIEVADVVHMPHADILEIAQQVVAER
jgi:hypothetical protein